MPLTTALTLALLASAPDAGSPASLPERIHLESRTRAITRSRELALHEGRIYWRSPAGPDGGGTPWALLPPDGLPAPGGTMARVRRKVGARERFLRPVSVRELTADGENLVALSSTGAVYYTKLGTLDWVELWGPLPLKARLVVDFPYRSLEISHRGADSAYYEDIDGNRHPVSAGVTTLYLLSEDGRELRYADPWLPPDFDRWICPPLRGRFTAEAMSASASTLFLVDRSGRMFTRLADFDTVGDDPVLKYSYERKRRSGPMEAVVRSLPPEDWREQPRIAGRHTTRITILQTGKGNAARELRVEGVDGPGQGGYWRKALEADGWTFVPTGETPTGRFVEPGLPPDALLGPTLDLDLAGLVRGRRAREGLRAELVGFQPRCSPATLRLHAGEHAYEARVHFRAPRRSLVGKGTVYRAMVELPTPAAGNAAGDAARLLFGPGPLVPASLLVSSDQVVLRDPSFSAGTAEFLIELSR